MGAFVMYIDLHEESNGKVRVTRFYDVEPTSIELTYTVRRPGKNPHVLSFTGCVSPRNQPDKFTIELTQTSSFKICPSKNKIDMQDIYIETYKNKKPYVCFYDLARHYLLKTVTYESRIDQGWFNIDITVTHQKAVFPDGEIVVENNNYHATTTLNAYKQSLADTNKMSDVITFCFKKGTNK